MPHAAQIMLTTHCKETTVPLFVNLAQLRLLPKRSEGAQPRLSEVATYPRQQVDEHSAIFYVNPEQEDVREVVLSRDLDGHLNGVLDTYTSLNFDKSGVLSYLDVAVQCNTTCNTDRVVLMQALGAELALTGTLGVRLGDKVAYGKDVMALLDEAGVSLDDIRLALHAGTDPFIDFAVDIVELPVLQWEHSDNGEPISHVIDLLFADPLVMLSYLSRAMQSS